MFKNFVQKNFVRIFRSLFSPEKFPKRFSFGGPGEGAEPYIRKLLKNLVTIFFKNLFGKLVTIFGKSVHIFWKLVATFGKFVTTFGKLIWGHDGNCGFTSVVIYSISSSESLRVVHSLQIVNSLRVLFLVFIKFKGFLVEFLENRRSSENQKPPENRQKSGLF